MSFPEVLIVCLSVACTMLIIRISQLKNKINSLVDENVRLLINEKLESTRTSNHMKSFTKLLTTNSALKSHIKAMKKEIEGLNKLLDN